MKQQLDTQTQGDINMEMVIYKHPSDIFEYSGDTDILATEVSDFEILSIMWSHEAVFEFSVKEFGEYLNKEKQRILKKRIN